MPIYEYRCQDCHYEFERMQKFSDPPIEACPTCAGSVQKLISRSAFHLKGSGWYVTDYARNAGQKSDSPEKSAAESDKGSTEKTTSETSTSEKSDSSSATSNSSPGSGSESTTKKSPSGTAAA